VTIAVADPFSGANEYSCVIAGPLLGRATCEQDGSSDTQGSSINIVYDLTPPG